MKNTEPNKKTSLKRFLFSRFFAEVYYFFALHLYLIFSILGIALSIAVILFFAEIIFPKTIHLFNYSMSSKVFSELVENHQYHAAIAFMEAKKDLIEESHDPYKFRQELAYCYLHTGDYPKALEQHRLLQIWFDNKINEEANNMTPSQIKEFKKFLNICFRKEEFQIYLKMGDITNINKCYNTIKTLHETTDWNNFLNFIDEDNKIKLIEFFDGRNFVDGFRLELIQGLYISDPNAAIKEMEEYAIQVANSTKFNQVYKLHLLNELIKMLIQQGHSISARHYLEFALYIVDSLEYNSIIYPQLGELSDYCYELNDIENSHRLLKKYLWYIDKTFDPNDIDYIVAHVKEFKHLESASNWKALSKRAVKFSEALRIQIANNLTGMTSAQREFFIAQFEPLFTYINHLMEISPSEDLAVTCFENNMFLRGLLLRSETSIYNAIEAIKDNDLTKKYHRYIELSKELISRQYVSGPGNFIKKKNIEAEITCLETDIANKCRDFRRENEKQNLSVSSIKKHLNKDDIIIQIIDGKESFYALLMDYKGNISYFPIGAKETIKNLLTSHGTIYVDNNSVQNLFGSIIPKITNKNIYITTTGVFNQIAFSALPIDANGRIFADIANIHLIGSTSDLTTLKSIERINIEAKTSILWGGIIYGQNDTILDSPSPTREVLRGDIIISLPNSLSEVNQIAKMLKSNGNNPIIISGTSASEKSFTNRSQKRDYILHISTHGFFHDSGAFTNPMKNSGLLFANSQDFWSSKKHITSINESDGILRSDEIEKLNLNGCRLVVLSACQTGLGEYNSEGVYGLQRAFKLAGAQSILMSLWNVDDLATCELITAFYEKLILGQEPNLALANAQRILRAKGYSPDKWAAFVLLN